MPDNNPLPGNVVSSLDQAEALWEFAGRCIANFYNSLIAGGVPVEVAQIIAVNASQIFIVKLTGAAPTEV